jgi:hypothetical protein
MPMQSRVCMQRPKHPPPTTHTSAHPHPHTHPPPPSHTHTHAPPPPHTHTRARSYAKTAGKDTRASWLQFTKRYFLQRPTLVAVLLLVDASIPPQAMDLECASWLAEAEVRGGWVLACVVCVCMCVCACACACARVGLAGLGFGRVHGG